MKKLGLLLLTCIGMMNIQRSFSQCTVSISSSDTLVCYSDTIALTANTYGPGNTLMASNTAGNNHRGNMFDIVATNDVTILSFDASPMGNTTIEIYYKAGTWNGFANTPSAWTFIGAAPVTYTGGFTPVAVPVNVTIPAGQTYAFYVTSNTSAVSLNYSNGNNVGNVYSSDANITFLEGGGLDYPFTQNTGAVYQPRVWNGNIHYCLAGLPTTYLWGQGQTTNTLSEVITANTQYVVESTIAGCPSTLYDTLNIATSIPFVDAGTDFQVCAGDSVTLGITGPFNYSWDNGVINNQTFMPTATLDYVVTATDTAGCVALDTVTVQHNPLPLVQAGPDLSICEGSSATLSGTGADTYIWTNGIIDGNPFIPIVDETYIVTGTDVNGCQNSDTMQLSVYEFTTEITVSGEIILIGNPGTGVTYQWYNCTTNQSIAGQTGQAYVATENGSYAVIINNGQCSDTTACVTVTTVGLTEGAMNGEFSVYPNPSTGTITLTNVANAGIEITDLNGRIIRELTGNATETDTEIVLENNGVYFVTCTKNGIRFTQRVVIQKN
jgi:hypothetical protein